MEETPSESPFKKKKDASVKDHQSEKKSRSFVIHSRNGSVKDRTERNESMNRSKFSEKKSRKNSMEGESNRSDSVNQMELYQLRKHIAVLHEKLKKIEERQ